jgi:hypothetical protein
MEALLEKLEGKKRSFSKYQTKASEMKMNYSSGNYLVNFRPDSQI